MDLESSVRQSSSDWNLVIIVVASYRQMHLRDVSLSIHATQAIYCLIVPFAIVITS